MQDTSRAQRRLVLQGLGAMPLPFAAFAEFGQALERGPKCFNQRVRKAGIES